MELQQATVLELIDELQNRQIEFLFIANEDTNSNRDKAAWFSMKGKDKASIKRLSRVVDALASAWKAPSSPDNEALPE